MPRHCWDTEGRVKINVRNPPSWLLCWNRRNLRPIAKFYRQASTNNTEVRKTKIEGYVIFGGRRSWSQNLRKGSGAQVSFNNLLLQRAVQKTSVKGTVLRFFTSEFFMYHPPGPLIIPLAPFRIFLCH